MAGTATRSGDVLNDAYALEERLSSEGPLEVYRATDRRTRAIVRVKVLRAEFALQAQVVDKFLRAPRALSALSHASLPFVRVDTDETGIPFVVEEAIEGRALSSLTDSFPQGLPLAMVAPLCVPLAEALALAHREGFTHGAIDEDHVRISGPPDAPQPKLVGLGLASEERGVQHEAFVAPELGGAPAARPTPQADVYAFGVLLYRMLSGELPFRSGKRSAVPLDEIAPHLPAAWVELTGACLQASRVKRIKDAGALLTQLRACTEPPSQAAKPGPAAELRAQATVVGRKGADSKAPGRPSPAPSDPRRDSARARALEATVQAKPASSIHATATGRSERDAPAIVPEATPAVDRELQKKQAAKTAAEKLSAKNKQERSSKDPPRASFGTADAKPDASSAAPTSGAPAPEPKTETAHPPSKRPVPKSEAPRPVPKIEAPKSVPAATAAASQPPAPRPSLVAKPAQAAAAVALSVAQLDALRALRAREEEEESRDRILGLFFMLLFLLLLLYGTPLLTEPDFETARASFGPKLRLATTAFAVFAVIGTVRALIATQRSLVQRVRSLVLQVVIVCILLVTLTLYSSAPALGVAAGFARRFLPWGTGATFFVFGFEYARRGIQQLATQFVYGVLALALAGGSGYGSIRSLIGAVRAEKQRAAALLAKRNPDASTSGTLDPLKRELLDKSAPSGDGTQADSKSMKQRKELGASEEQDMMPASELEASRAKNKSSLEALQKRGPKP